MFMMHNVLEATEEVTILLFVCKCVLLPGSGEAYGKLLIRN